jgi:type IV secretion system protein VirB5
MTRKAKLLALGGAAAALAVAAVPASAMLGGSIVHDPTNYGQILATVRQLADTYKVTVDQLAEARRQVEALTSKNGLGHLLNSTADQGGRRYMPDAGAAARDVDTTAGAVTGAVGATRGLMADATTLYRPATAAELDSFNTSGPEVQQYQREVGTALAVLAGSHVILDQSAKRRDTYEGLMARIETAPDAKAAADLSNRIEAENGLTSNELARATAMQAHVLATQEMRLASDRASAARATARTRTNLSGGTYASAQ